MLPVAIIKMDFIDKNNKKSILFCRYASNKCLMLQSVDRCCFAGWNSKNFAPAWQQRNQCNFVVVLNKNNKNTSVENIVFFKKWQDRNQQKICPKKLLVEPAKSSLPIGTTRISCLRNGKKCCFFFAVLTSKYFSDWNSQHFLPVYRQKIFAFSFCCLDQQEFCWLNQQNLITHRNSKQFLPA